MRRVHSPDVFPRGADMTWLLVVIGMTVVIPQWSQLEVDDSTTPAKIGMWVARGIGRCPSKEVTVTLFDEGLQLECHARQEEPHK